MKMRIGIFNFSFEEKDTFSGAKIVKNQGMTPYREG